MAGIGQQWAGAAATVTSALIAASGAGSTLLTLTSQNGLSIVSVWLWARQPQDASMQNFTVNFGATVLGFVPVVGGPENAVIPCSFLFTGDGATAVTVKNVGATLSQMIGCMFTVLAANA